MVEEASSGSLVPKSDLVAEGFAERPLPGAEKR